MKKILSWVLAAALICGLNVLTACSIEDNIGGQALTPAELQKQWISDYAEEGIDDEFDEPYNRVVEVYEFFDDNTGFYELYRLDGGGLVNVKSLRGDNGDFTYSLSGNTVKITMLDDASDKTLTYANGQLADPQKALFIPSTPDQEELVLTWCSFWRGGDDQGDALVEYIERSWDGQKVVEKELTTKAQWLNDLASWEGDQRELKNTWYVTGNCELDFAIVVDHNLNIILCDDAVLKVKAIIVQGNYTVRIYGQKGGTGQLIIDDTPHCPAIGPDINDGGYIEIHGGQITVEGSNGCAGIGGGYKDIYNNPPFVSHNSVEFARINIYGGIIHAKGGGAAAGIGGGVRSQGAKGIINIYGGYIDADGGGYAAGFDCYGGAGIGGGSYSPVESVNIYGGYIHATGGNEASGIGCGEEAEGQLGMHVYLGTGVINISGGEVDAWGGDHGAGIGGGDGVYLGKIHISGGKVYAHGGVNAAGIGGGEGAQGGNIEITGGTVYAYAGADGAGIGGGEDGDGGEITISGGLVFAYGKTASNNGFGAGIGGGQDGNSGTITIRRGEVHAYGGDDAAGIGTGEETTSGPNIKADNITISGGTVEAVGGGYGAGVGAGQDAEVGTITVTTESGSVYVSGRSGDDCGWWAGAFGAYKEDARGTLNIGKGVKTMSIETDYSWSTIPVEWNPVAFAQQRCHVQILTCDHPGYSAETCIFCKH